MVKVVSNVDMSEDLFGIGHVEVKANKLCEIPKQAYDAWKYRGYDIKLENEANVVAKIDELDDMEYNALKALAKDLGIDLPRSIKKPELLAAIREARAKQATPPETDVDTDNLGGDEDDGQQE